MFLVQCPSGGMVDAADSKSADGNIVGVRLPPRAPNKKSLVIFINRIAINLHISRNTQSGFSYRTVIAARRGLGFILYLISWPDVSK